MSLHIVAGFADQARRGKPSIVYCGEDLAEGLRVAGEAMRAGKFKSFGRLSHPLWIPAKPAEEPKAPAAKPADNEHPKKPSKEKESK